MLRVFLRGTAARGAESLLTRVGQLAALARHRRAANTRDGSARNVHAQAAFAERTLGDHQLLFVR